jgi:hypothetical protein
MPDRPAVDERRELVHSRLDAVRPRAWQAASIAAVRLAAPVLSGTEIAL